MNKKKIIISALLLIAGTVCAYFCGLNLGKFIIEAQEDLVYYFKFRECIKYAFYSLSSGLLSLFFFKVNKMLGD